MTGTLYTLVCWLSNLVSEQCPNVTDRLPETMAVFVGRDLKQPDCLLVAENIDFSF